ncbi:MAG: hypothetical protein ACLFNS_07195 [Desulfobacterales bacterium]
MIIIDFEASSQRKNSYPIEVAWGEGPDSIKSFLLNPDYMAGWTDWNPQSRKFHGITREELRRHGSDPRQVAAQMVEELAGRDVYSDEPKYDNRWKNRLLSDSGYDPSVIRIQDLNVYLKHMINAAAHCQTYNEFVCSFECCETRQHRAGVDVYWLFKLMEYIEENICKDSS